jgi:hypothetical protein
MQFFAYIILVYYHPNYIAKTAQVGVEVKFLTPTRYGLFNDSLEIVWRRMAGREMNDELENI